MGCLDAKVALITGAAQGIGAAIARRLAAEGALVAVNDIELSPALSELAREIDAMPACADLGDPGASAAVVDSVTAELGEIELLVANAAHMQMGAFPPGDWTGWWRQLDVNLSGTFRLVRAAVSGMRRLGRGRIVIVSSYWGIEGWPEASGYAASKAGLIALGKTLGRELAPEGILANVVAPGVIDTPQLEVDARNAGIGIEEIRATYAREIPARRVGRPEEVAATVAFLCGDGAGAFVGQVLQPNGGELRCQS